MSRIPRRFQWSDEACFHLMNRGHNREAVFLDDDDRNAFLGLVTRYQRRYGFCLYHYCLITNHFHLLLQLLDPRQVSGLMAGLLRAYGHHCHRRHGFVGHRWQGRFKSPAVQRREYLLSCGRYIERNPVEAGIVTEPWDYAWSSARANALGETDERVAENKELFELGTSPAERQTRWRAFLLGQDPNEDAVRRAKWAVGDDAFRRQVLMQHGRPAPRGRGRPPKSARGSGAISSEVFSVEKKAGQVRY
jgi:putative transposase